MFKIDNTNKITMVRGDTAVFTLTLAGYALSQGDQVKFTVKRSANESKAYITKTITEFNDGKAIITLNEEDTKTMPDGDYLYEVECRLQGGVVDTVITSTKFVLIADLG